MAFTLTELQLPSGPLSCHVGGTGQPVLYLHSAGGVRISPAIEKLAESFRLYLPVIPGFDGTARRDTLRTMSDLADLAAEIIDSEIKEPCDVVGHSFGGWVAAWLAARHPEKVPLLVLHAAAGFRPEGKGGRGGDPETLRRAMYAHPENLPSEPVDPARHAANRAAAQDYTGGQATDRDLVGSLDRITALTLIMHGTKDGVVPVESPRLLKSRIPHAFCVYVYDAAHAIDTDQPDRFADLVGDFLTRGEAFIVNRSKHAEAEPKVGAG
jgi:pimeloyl-ACP methyl ester carboxylesterase